MWMMSCPWVPFRVPQDVLAEVPISYTLQSPLVLHKVASQENEKKKGEVNTSECNSTVLTSW